MIRRATKADIPDLNRLLRQVLQLHHQGRPDLFKDGAKKYTDAELKELLGDDSRPVFVYTDGKEDGGKGVCGYAFCVFQRHVEDNILTDIKTLYIDDLCVDESMRGRHIGRSLYEYVLQYAREKGCYNVTLNVWSCNERAAGFYRACGMTPQKIGMEKILQPETETGKR